MRVLLIEDELRLASTISAALLEGAGLLVDHAADGAEGLNLLGARPYDLVVLDLMLPVLDGSRVVQRMRAKQNATPVLVLTACDDRGKIVELLNAGADDYLTKPFDLGELLARSKALIRRSKGMVHPEVELGGIRLNTIEQTVHAGLTLVDLSPTEYRIVEYLMYRPRAIVSKRELLEHLYDFRWEHHSNIIEAHVSNLRRKLRATGIATGVETIRGRGYRLSNSVEAL